jgi:crotonobetainyl-CoA:carnitine CoA-transferase CaiB-like acyl-CoA transferase
MARGERFNMTRPLEGIRVIDFGRFIAAPYCAMMLADFGADVIRVERREGGEDRRVGPIIASGDGGLYLNVNRNKRAITLDLGHAEGAKIVRRLIESADIVVVNLPINVMKKVGLDYESVRQIKPEIILVMASAFGPDGPYANRVGFDGVAQAMSGAMSLTGFPDAPVRDIVSFVDYGTALHAAFGAMVALYERQRTGRGSLIDVSLLATGVTFMLPLLAERAATGIRRERQGNTAFYTAPSDVYRTSDGWIIVPTIGDDMFGRWARLVGREDLIADPRCADDITRGGNHALINEVMKEWCAAHTRDEAIGKLERARVPCGPVYDLDEVLADPQLAARGLLEEVEQTGDGARVPLSQTAVRINGERGPLCRAPALGEHTNEVLAELGFSAEEIAELRKVGAV